MHYDRFITPRKFEFLPNIVPFHTSAAHILINFVFLRYVILIYRGTQWVDFPNKEDCKLGVSVEQCFLSDKLVIVEGFINSSTPATIIPYRIQQRDTRI
jgi:hypothetical protein